MRNILFFYGGQHGKKLVTALTIMKFSLSGMRACSFLLGCLF